MTGLSALALPALPSWLRFWWAPVLVGVAGWALIERAEKADIAADLVAEKAAHQASAANWEAATNTARLLDRENKRLVEAQQAAESRRISDDYQARIDNARARAAAAGLRVQAAPADQGGRGEPPMPGLPDPARGIDAAACEARLPAGLSAADALIATEQAIQLDELINWVAAQAAIDRNGKEVAGDQ
ncbi:MAG: hypothetical protein KAF42_08500 [Sphingopyxis terrae]|nr:hypothetical protein [Sphingopyxis terrae]